MTDLILTAIIRGYFLEYKLGHCSCNVHKEHTWINCYSIALSMIWECAYSGRWWPRDPQFICRTASITLIPVVFRWHFLLWPYVRIWPWKSFKCVGRMQERCHYQIPCDVRTISVSGSSIRRNRKPKYVHFIIYRMYSFDNCPIFLQSIKLTCTYMYIIKTKI